MKTPGRSLILTTDRCDPSWFEGIARTARSEHLDIEVVKIPGENGKIRSEDILAELWKRGVQKVLVEGGSSTISEFVGAGLFDRFTIYFGPMVVGGTGPTIMGGPGLSDPPLAVKVKNAANTPDGGFLVEFTLPEGP